jgi:hypothetical protein
LRCSAVWSFDIAEVVAQFPGKNLAAQRVWILETRCSKSGAAEFSVATDAISRCASRQMAKV